MVYPTLPAVAISIALPIFGIPLVYLLSKALKINSKPIVIDRPRRQATITIIVTAALFGKTILWGLFTNVLSIEMQSFVIDATFFLWNALDYGISFLIVIVAMLSTRQKLATIGISKANMGKMIALGAGLSAISLAVMGLLSPIIGQGFAGFSSSLAFTLIFCTMVGFSEETLFRGYIQTRLTAYAGSAKGLAVSTVIFAFIHFAIVYYAEASGDLLATLAWVLLRIGGPNLILGYTMLKSQNIVPGSIFHLFYDWGIFLWRLIY